MPRTVAAAKSAPPTSPPAPAGGLAPLTRDEVAAQTDAGSFQRGVAYHRAGRIFDGVRRGATLRARCHGSSGGPYRVEATLAATDALGKRPSSPVAYACSCPRGGFCKHVVALLLTWIDTPDAFEERPPLAALLEHKTREELVALIEVLLREAPELEDLLGLPLVVAGRLDAAPVDEAAIRRQVAAALADGGDGEEEWYGRGRYDDRDWYGGYGPRHDAAKLARLVALGEAYAEAGRWRDALAVFAPLIEAAAPDLEPLLDEEGHLADALAAADRALAAALDAQGRSPSEARLARPDRERLTEVLYDLWEADVESGGRGIAEEGPAAIARSATADEQRQVAARLRAAIGPARDDYSSQRWVNQAAIRFLSLLAGDAGLSSDELLAEYRNAELWEEAADTLVRLDRVEEAIALAARRLTAAPVLTRFADRLVASDDDRRREQAIELVESRLWEREGHNARDDVLLMEWLERQYAAGGRPERALETARRRFKLAPGKATFDAVRLAALLPGQPNDPWPALRADLLAALAQRGDWGALIEIHLEAGDIAEALAALTRMEQAGTATAGYGYGSGYGYGWGGGSGGYAARVAAAAERDFPDQAVAIYRRLADRLIEARQRTAYREAAGYLARVAAILTGAGRAAEWQTVIADLRQRNKTLRALREELDALGLA